MEWTAQTIREVEFREKLRGYHPDDVDAFVEQVAAAFQQLETSLRSAVTAPVAEGADAISDDTIRKTLLMAQRTADLVVSEAEESAARLLGDARTEADALVAEANRLADDLQDEAHRRLTTHINELEAVRGSLQRDVDVLHDYVDRQRRRLRELLVEQLRVLDEGESPLETPPAAAPTEPLTEPLTAPLTAEAASASAPEAAEPPAVATEPDTDDVAVVDVDVLARSVHLPAEGEDDPFLAELRRAIDDPTAVGPAQGDRGDADDEAPDAEDFEIRRSSTAAAVRAEDVAVYGAPGSEGNRLGGRLFRRR